jgi:hypothetical protein
VGPRTGLDKFAPTRIRSPDRPARNQSLYRLSYFSTFIMLSIFNCNWVDTRWQQYSTHLHTNSTQNAENGTYITIKRKNGKCGPCHVFGSYTLAFALQLRRKHGKISGRVVEKCPISRWQQSNTQNTVSQ